MVLQLEAKSSGALGCRGSDTAHTQNTKSQGMGIAAQRALASPLALSNGELGDPGTAQCAQNEEDGCVCGGSIDRLGGV